MNKETHDQIAPTLPRRYALAIAALPLNSRDLHTLGCMTEIASLENEALARLQSHGFTYSELKDTPLPDIVRLAFMEEMIDDSP